MNLLGSDVLGRLIETWGVWAVALVVAAESSGIPLPGETVVVVAALHAGRTHALSIGSVIAAAAVGAIVGDNLGFAAGRAGGFRLLRRHGGRIHLDERRLKLGLYLFRRYGVLLVFFGRFVAVLRAWVAILAGANRLPWRRFLAANVAGGVAWASSVGLTAYLLGDEAAHLTSAVSHGVLAAASVGLVIAMVLLRRNERRLEDEAERALPGPIDQYL